MPRRRRPPTLRRLAERVDARLDALLDDRARALGGARRRLWRTRSTRSRRLVLSGGKRLRPAFCHWGYVGAGGGDDDQIDIDAGAAFELMHAFALFHDDVMDDAATRRGQPTTHALSAADHAAARLGRRVAPLRRGRGDPRRRSRLRVRRPAAGGRTARGVAALERAAHRTQHRPVPRHPRVGPARATARRRPSASAATSGASTRSNVRCTSAPCSPIRRRADELLPALSAYGLPLGDAFQMRDDVMGAFGDASGHRQAGRRRSHRGQADTAAGPAVARADAAQRAVLDLVGDPDLSTADVGRIQQVIVDTGALDELEAHITATRRTRRRRHRGRRHHRRRQAGARRARRVRDRRATYR